MTVRGAQCVTFPSMRRLATGAVSSSRGGPEEALLSGDDGYEYEENDRGSELREETCYPHTPEESPCGDGRVPGRNERDDLGRSDQGGHHRRGDASRDGRRGGSGSDGGGEALDEATRPGWRQVVGSANFRAAAVVREAHLNGLHKSF